jgi:PAS domain S-box-containing protein
MDKNKILADHPVVTGSGAPATTEWPPGAEQDVQEALRLAQANLLRYQELFDFAPDGYLVTDAQAIIQQANHEAAAMLGTRKEFLAGKPLLFFVGDNDRRSFTEKLYLLSRQPESRLHWEMTLDPPRGPRLWVLVTAASAPATLTLSVTPPPSAEWGTASIRWTLRDITRRKQAEQTLQLQRDFAESLVEMAEAVILVLDAAGCIVRTNTYQRSLTGHRPDQLEGRPMADLLVSEDWPAAQPVLLLLAEGHRKARGIHRLRTRDGHTRMVAWSARALAPGLGGRELILVVGNDVTDLHEAQQRALQAERLAAIGQMAAGLAHESRNALQRSQACLTLLGFRLAGQPEALELLARVQKAQDDLHRLFEDVREYAGPICLELCRCHLDEVWRQAWEDLSTVRLGKVATLVEETGGVDLECMASPFHLLQVFRNLFENALAAAAVPRVTLCCAPADLDGREAIQVAVQDNGSGFAEEEKQRAFEVFFTTRIHGTGLGLAICKRIIEAHGGRIAVGESPESGALLLLTLPRRPT